MKNSLSLILRSCGRFRNLAERSGLKTGGFRTERRHRNAARFCATGCGERTRPSYLRQRAVKRAWSPEARATAGLWASVGGEPTTLTSPLFLVLILTLKNENQIFVTLSTSAISSLLNNFSISTRINIRSPSEPSPVRYSVDMVTANSGAGRI